MNINYFNAAGKLGPPRDQMARFPRLLSWQTILPFPHQIPIGNPVAYFLKTIDDEFFPSGNDLNVSERSFTLVMPRMDKDLSLSQRIDRYKALAEKGLSESPRENLVFSLHPKEFANQEVLEDLLGSYGEFFWRGEADFKTDLKQTFGLMNACTELWSDYFGAHVFQAAAFFGTSSRLFGNELFKDVYHESINPYLQDFFAGTGDIEAQREVSSKVLGLEHIRPIEDLREILGFDGLRGVLGKPVRFAYRRIRRIKMRWRVARGRQSPRKSAN